MRELDANRHVLAAVSAARRASYPSPSSIDARTFLPSSLPKASSRMVDAQAVQSALDTLNRPGDKVAFAAANTWLQDFQHSVNTFRPMVPSSLPADTLDVRTRRGQHATSFFAAKILLHKQKSLLLRLSAQRYAGQSSSALNRSSLTM